jgi:hypothetical protein
MPKKSKPIIEKPPDGVSLVKEKSPYRTVKTSLTSIIKNQDILRKINDLVVKCNHIVIDTYMFIRLYCLHLYHTGKEIPDLDEKFISYCMMTLGERDNRGKKPANTELVTELTAFYTEEFQPIFNHRKFDMKCMSYTLPYICQTMETCLSVNLKEHFVKRLLRFINVFAAKYYDEHINTDNTPKTKKEMIWKLKKAVTDNKYDDIPDSLKPWFEIHRVHILPKTFEKSVAYDCKVNPYKYIKYSFYMNQKYEEYNKTLESKSDSINYDLIKLFQPLSLRKTNVPRYITIDTATLINIFSEKGKKGKLLQTLKENQELVWNDYFRMDKKVFRESKEYSFNYTLQTDGVGVSLLFKHNTLKDKKYGSKVKEVDDSIPYLDHLSDTQLDIMKNKKIVTADPGKLYLLYMMDDEGNTLKYSCKQRDTESLAKRNRRIKITNKKQSSYIIDTETELSNTSSNTVDYEKFKDFIRLKHITNEKTTTFYEQPLYRKLIWRTKTYRQRSEDKFLDNISKSFGDKEDIVVCVGDWSNAQGSCIKGASTMSVGLKRLVNKKYTTLLLDEYNTSKKCCNCWEDTENVKVGGDKKFRLLKCGGCDRKKKDIGSPEDEYKTMFNSYMTRDKNSCVNMMSIVKHMIYNKRTRPEPFCRS